VKNPALRLLIAGSAACAATIMATSFGATAAPQPVAAPIAVNDQSVHGHDHDTALTAIPPDDPARGLRYGGLRIAKSGPCLGAYEVVGVDFTMCTHGPDAPPAGLDVFRQIEPLAPRTAGVGTQALAVCEGDGTSGRRVEVLYVRGSTSRYSQFLETFRTLAEDVDRIFFESARETGGDRRVRYVTETINGQCRPVVRDVQISDAALNANDWAPLLNAVRAAGYTRTDRKYLQFVDARVFCGIGGFAGDTTKSDNNASNRGPEYARADNGCWNAGVAAHELGHTLGAVNNNAPNGSGFAHCEDEWDVMCYKDDASTVIRTVCTDRAHDQRLDCNHDDYYHTNPAAGSYLANFYNVADNLFLIKPGTTPPSPSPTVSPTVSPPTIFRLVNGASSTCLDVPNSNSANGTQLIIWTCNGGANQNVTRSGNALQMLGKCLDAFGAGTANGTRVVLWTCSGAVNQQWTLRPDGSIAGVQSGRCLTPTSGGTANGTLIILSDCNGQPYQRWNRT
jgi:hypothetical protein